MAAAERTVEITDLDFSDDVSPSAPARSTPARELTLELSDVDLETAEDTLPDAAAPPTSSPSSHKDADADDAAAARKRERNRRRRERKKRRKNKAKS